MALPTGYTQINLIIPEAWKEQIKRSARNISVEEDKTISYSELIKRTIKEKFELEDIPKTVDKKPTGN